MELYIKDELNLYLVANNLKPATTITAHPYERNYEDEKQEELAWRFLEGRDIAGLQAYEDLCSRISGIKTLLSADFQHYMARGINTRNFPITVSFDVATSEDNLERLFLAGNDIRYGFAYGYPEEAVHAFSKVIDGVKRNGTYFSVCLARAKRLGIELPLWLAYISFVPDRMDIASGDVSMSSRQLGERYMKFVRANNPSLAEKVEKYFKEEPLPERWCKLRDGSYFWPGLPIRIK